LASGAGFSLEKSDFAGFAVCSRLRAMPKSAKLLKCNVRTPLRGECRFRLANGSMSIDYQAKDGFILKKITKLTQNSAGPYGLTGHDNVITAARKIKNRTGLSAKFWDDVYDLESGYLQSEPVSCGRNKAYSVYVWFKDGRASQVSVSTLPAL
jgi:hypothetical protein